MTEGRWVTVHGRPVYIQDTPAGTVAAKPRHQESDLHAMVRQSKERERQRDREAKAATGYAVFPHSIDGRPTGRGFVTRPVDLGTGKPHDSRNYGGVPARSKVYRRRADADRAMENMT